MNILTRVISILSPEWAFRRERAFAAYEQLRKYNAASREKRMRNWHTKPTSVNTENIDVPLVRDRARDLVRNSPIASKGLSVLVNNAVGSGVRAKIISSKQNQKRLDQAWKSWAESTDCDFDGRLNLYGLQALAIRSVMESGDCIIRFRRASGKPVPLELQILEGDFIDHNKTESLSGGGYIIQGVEFDKLGKRVAYWLYDQHPGDPIHGRSLMYESSRVSAEEIIHVYEVLRPGQVRGVSRLSSIMTVLKNFDDYEDAQLIRQKIAACFAVFVQDSVGGAIDNVIDADEEDDGTLSERITPGTIEHLPAGKSVTFANPPITEGYGEYMRNVLRSVAAGLGITYESLTGDLSGVNFSSIRVGVIEALKNFEHIQNNVIIPFMDKIFNWFLQATEISGLNKGSEVKVLWTTPRREMLDPLKEITALGEEVKFGFTSWSEAVTSRGWDPNELLEALATDRDNFEKFKLILRCDPSKDPEYISATKQAEKSPA